jgi:hypothetical protein
MPASYALIIRTYCLDQASELGSSSASALQHTQSYHQQIQILILQILILFSDPSRFNFFSMRAVRYRDKYRTPTFLLAIASLNHILLPASVILYSNLPINFAVSMTLLTQSN